MKNFLRFHLFQMKYMLGIQDLQYRIRTTSGLVPKLIALSVPLILLAAVVVTPYLLILYVCYEMMRVGGSPESYINLVLLLGQGLILFFALLSAFTAMFGKKDHDFLSSLPIPKRYIYFSTVLHVYSSGVVSAALILIPSLIIYSIGQGFSLQMMIMLIPAILLTPVLPVCLAFALVLLIMRLVALCPFKEQLATALGIVFLLGYMAVNFFFSARFGEWIANMGFVELFERSGVISAISKVLPGIYLTRLTFIGSFPCALLAFVSSLLIAGILFVAMYFLGSKSFFKIRANITTSSNRAKAVRYKESKPFWAYMKKEYLGILRSSVYVLNGLLGVILGPVVLIYMMVGGGLDSIENFRTVFVNTEARFAMLPVIGVLGIAYFMSSTVAMIPGSSYSREGLARWVTRVAPISDRTDFLGRAFAALVLFWVGECLTWGVGWYCFGFSLFDGLFFMVTLMISAVPCVFVSLFIDFKRPKLVWEKEAQAMKQNTNTLIGMLLSWLVGILCVVPLVLYLLGYIGITFTLLIAFAIPVVLAVASVTIILNKLNRRIVV